MTVSSHEVSAGPWLPGKYAIIAIGMMAVLLASAGVWYQYRLQHRPIAWWGVENAELFLRAPEVEVWRLTPGEPGAEANGETLTINGRVWQVVARKDVAGARGFSHVRRALVMDGTFDWDEPPEDCIPEWTDGLRFVQEGREAIVVWSFDCPRAALVGGERVISIRPVAEGLRAFFDEQFGEVGGE